MSPAACWGTVDIAEGTPTVLSTGTARCLAFVLVYDRLLSDVALLLFGVGLFAVAILSCRAFIYVGSVGQLIRLRGMKCYQDLKAKELVELGPFYIPACPSKGRGR